MTDKLSLGESQVLWITGACERLVGLGLLCDVPIAINIDSIDEYLLIDDYRHLLFDSDFEMVSIFKSMYEIFNEGCFDQEEFNMIVNMLLEFKNDRESLVAFALEDCIRI